MVDAGTCEVWWVRVSGDAPDLLDLLDPGERRRAADFGHAGSRALFVAARALARLVLGAHLGLAPGSLRFDLTCRCGSPHGKPQLIAADPPRFSLSHSGDVAVLALTASTPVGVDVERVQARREAALAGALSAVERTVLDRLAPADREAGFARYWTRKEAALKATGAGLSIDPRTVVLSPPSAPPRLLEPPDELAGVRLADLVAVPGYAGTVAVVGGPLAVAERSGDHLLYR
jgi:4'-phosphopantetheinyl transferase